MSEFIFDDGRKAEKVENALDPLTKVTEVYVEPRLEKKLAKRITERLCVCERVIETIDEHTGEVVDRVVEKTCGESMNSRSSNVFALAEKKISDKKKVLGVLLVVAVVVQVAVIAYVLFA